MTHLNSGCGGSGACGCAGERRSGADNGAGNDTGKNTDTKHASHSFSSTAVSRNLEGRAADSTATQSITNNTIPAAPVMASINGVDLPPGDEHSVREAAWTELLRQQAVQLGYLDAQAVTSAPEPDEQQRQAIEAMLDAEVTSPDPTEEECQRFYEANRAHFTVGQAVQLRHILFAVTPGVNVQLLIRRAEDALMELTRKDASPERFAQLAAELSNCPSGAQGGELGWVAPAELAPELARELFFKPEAAAATGLLPRLVHSRFGLHIVDITDRKAGTLPEFAQVRSQITARLKLQSRSTALRQYMRLLVGQAEISGIALEGEASPLVQ